MVKKSKSSRQTDARTEMRHLGILIEHVGDDVKLVAEQYGDIKKDIHDIKKAQNTHTEMIGNLTVDITIIKEDIEFIKNSLKRKVDADEFSALERRVAVLERHR